MRRRVVVTAAGVVAATGIGVEAFWNNLDVTPDPGPRRVEGWDPELFIPRREHRRMDRFTQFAMVAAAEALAAAGPPAVPSDRVGVSVATGIGGLASLEDLVLATRSEEPRVSPTWIPMMMCNAAAASISIKYGFRGAVTTPVIACAAGAQAIADAFRQIQWGHADAMIAGGAEAAVGPTTLGGFAAARALSPSGVARPFDAGRDGFVMGEGAGILVLEERQAAAERGAPILCEVAGAASTADAHHLTAPPPDGEGAERAVRLAIGDAGINPEDLGYVNAHGTGTDLNDLVEGAVIARTFPNGQPPVSSIKGVTGHALGASGALEAVASVLAVARAELPPNVGLIRQDPAIPLTDIVTARRTWQPGWVVSNSFGFGGHNTVLVFGPAG